MVPFLEGLPRLEELPRPQWHGFEFDTRTGRHHGDPRYRLNQSRREFAGAVVTVCNQASTGVSWLPGALTYFHLCRPEEFVNRGAKPSMSLVAVCAFMPELTDFDAR